LRRKFQNKYESYADMTLNEWIQLRVEVQGQKAKLYINNNKQPSLIVNDLKLGSNETGSIGLFVDVGTEGYFKDVKVYLQ
jgi:4-alpha-glucanotransferase